MLGIDESQLTVACDHRAANKQWQFVLHDTDKEGGKWIGGAGGGGDLAAHDVEIEKIKAQIAQLQKKLAATQAERTVAASGHGGAVQQSRRVEGTMFDPNKKHHKKQRQCCVFCFCILLGVVGAFLGDLIADESGGASFTAGGKVTSDLSVFCACFACCDSFVVRSQAFCLSSVCDSVVVIHLF